jgi:hypothetical protein
MRLEDGIVIFGGDALAGSKGLGDPAGLQSKGFLDAELAGQDVAMENKSTGVGGAFAGAGHGKFSAVMFREIATNAHRIYLDFRIAPRSTESGACTAYLLCCQPKITVDWT